MAKLAALDIENGVAIVTIDSPPVNALDAALRRDLHECLTAAFVDSEAQAVVLICAGRTFIAGADIDELGKPAAKPTFFDLFDMIEDGPKPVVAAIHGTALGGGFELALVCHYRIAAQSARVGLPEVTLGILPGAGGTQRVPRLAGAATALDILTSGRHVGAQEALATNLVDAVVPDAQLRAGAVNFAREVIRGGSRRPRIRDIALDPADAPPKLFTDFRTANAQRFRGFKAPDAIVSLVETAYAAPFEEGMAREAALFAKLVASAASAAQRACFVAERRTGRIPDIAADTPRIAVDTVGIVGAGTMGCGIAINFLNAGIPVTLIDTSEAALERGIGTIRRTYEGSVRKGRIDAGQAQRLLSMLASSTDIASLASADLAIEAVFESMAVKKEVFARLDDVASAQAILASNTSYLDLEEIAQSTRRPERVVGLHFFSPAHVMRLLEVVRTQQTALPAVATAMALARRIGKVPVLSRTCPGFIANRLLAPRGVQAEALALEGTPFADIDRALYDYGFAMGHFQMMDLVGLDVTGRDGEGRTVMGDLVAAGRLGQKQGGGYYDYDENRRGTPSAVAERIVAEVAATLGLHQHPPLSDEALIERLLYPVVNEGAKILEEGIAIKASDIDVAAVFGYNWPVYTGGPMFWAQNIGLNRVVDGLKRLEAMHGAVFRPADLLVRRARDGAPF